MVADAYHRDAQGEHKALELRPLADGAEQNPLHAAVGEIADALHLGLAALPVQGDVERVALALRLGIDGAEGLDKDQAVHVDGHDAQRHRAAGVEAAGQQIGPVAQLLGHLQHLAARLVAHAGLIVQRAQHRRAGNAADPGDFVDRDPHTLPRLSPSGCILRL